MRQNSRYPRQYGGTKGVSAHLETAWSQGVLFSLLYQQCADTIKDKVIVAIKRGNSKNRILRKNSKKTTHSVYRLTSVRHSDV